VTATLDPALLLRAYAVGVFPMADSREAEDVFWVEPRRRGILPLNGFHLSRSLGRTLRRETYRTTADRAFAAVMEACAEANAGRPETWINRLILDAYQQLHARGAAHSIECWQGDRLVGGLYGVKLGAAFFGESMFTRARDASKVALAHLVARLRVGGFQLLDTQFLTEHLASLGAVEVKRDVYRAMLSSAVAGTGAFGALDGLAASGGGVLPSAAGFGADERPPSPEAATVSGPISGKRIWQLLTQTS
jgi:leucyl/phenylalanyl-tRNA---protein transferase